MGDRSARRDPSRLGVFKLVALVRRLRDRSIDASEQSAAEHRHGQVLAVAAVTVANGADNLAVYIPLFGRDLAVVPVYAVVFALMTALWCVVGHWVVRHPRLGASIRRFGRWVLPLVLIAVGAHVLWSAFRLVRPPSD